jgi:hypothetical protein
MKAALLRFASRYLEIENQDLAEAIFYFAGLELQLHCDLYFLFKALPYFLVKNHLDLFRLPVRASHHPTSLSLGGLSVLEDCHNWRRLLVPHHSQVSSFLPV